MGLHSIKGILKLVPNITVHSTKTLEQAHMWEEEHFNVWVDTANNTRNKLGLYI